MFGIRREQGRLAELAAVARAFALSERATDAWRPGFAALLAELGMEAEARRELARVRERGLRRASLRDLAGVADVSHRRMRGGRRRDDGRARLPRTGAARGRKRGDRPRRRLLRRRRPLPGACSPRRSAITPARSSTSSSALVFNREMGATTWLAHTLYAYGRTLRMRSTADDAAPGIGAAFGGGDARRADRHARAAGTRAGARGAERASPRCPPDDLSWREVEILRLVAAGPQQSRDRRGAVHQRTHGRQPCAQHPAQDRRREPHRGRRLRVSPRPARTARRRGRIASCRCTSSSGRSPSSSI